MTYPPGVLTGHPMEWTQSVCGQDAHGRLSSQVTGEAVNIRMFGAPAQWSMDEIIELLNGIEDQLTPEMKALQDEMDILAHPTWVNHDDGTQEGWHQDSRITESLDRFAEDFDYEESLIHEVAKNAEVNLHRLLATQPDYRVGWVGELETALFSDSAGFLQMSPSLFQDNSGSIFLKERYTWNIKMTHSYPPHSTGYALGMTDYGKVYFPEKFRGYVPMVGEYINATVALQDVSPKANGKTNSFRFTAIFIFTHQ